MWPLLTNEPIDGDAVIHRQLRPAECAVLVDRADLPAAGVFSGLLVRRAGRRCVKRC